MLPGSFNQQWARIGNAVPPRLSEAIGKAILTEILLKL
jgi:site-specific DNA-cytosine methylase